jgi:hypothetical protein
MSTEESFRFLKMDNNLFLCRGGILFVTNTIRHENFYRYHLSFIVLYRACKLTRGL